MQIVYTASRLKRQTWFQIYNHAYASLISCYYFIIFPQRQDDAIESVSTTLHSDHPIFTTIRKSITIIHFNSVHHHTVFLCRSCPIRELDQRRFHSSRVILIQGLLVVFFTKYLHTNRSIVECHARQYLTCCQIVKRGLVIIIKSIKCHGLLSELGSMCKLILDKDSPLCRPDDAGWQDYVL